MTYILSFIAYLITISIIGWLANRPKKKKFPGGYITMHSSSTRVYKLRTMPVKRQLFNDELPWISSNGYGSTNTKPLEFKQQYLGKPFKPKEEK